MTGEVTALQSEFDAGGTFAVLRGYDAAHRLFRGRRTEAYTQMTASDIALQGRPAGRPPGRRGHQHDDGLRARHPGRDQRLGPPAAAGRRRRLRGHRPGGQVRVRPTHRGVRRPGGRRPGEREPAGAQAGRRPAPLPGRRDVGRAGQGGRGARLGHGHQAGADRHQAGHDHVGGAAGRRPGEARQDVRRCPLRLDRRPAPHPGGGGRRGGRSGRGRRRECSPSSRASRAGTRRCGPAPRSPMDGLGSPFDGKYTVTTSRHRLDPTTGYTTAFSVTGVRDRTLLGLAGGGGPATTAPPGVVVAVVDDVNDPEKTGRVRLRFPWLDDTYVSGWARTVQAGAGQGPRRAGAARGRRRGAGRLRAGRLPAPVRARRALQRRRPAQPQGHPRGRRRQGRGQPAVVGLPPGHRIDLLDEDGKTEGITVASGDGKVESQAGRDRHQGDRAHRRHRADRGKAGDHGRLRAAPSSSSRAARSRSRPPRA